MFKSDSVVAINFSDRSLEALQLKKSGKFLEVASSSRLRLPKDIIEDGKIIDVAKLKQAVQQLLEHAKPHSIKAKEVVFSIPESKVFVQTFALPNGVKSEELKQIAAQKAQEFIPIEPEFISADFQSYAFGDKQHVVYAATYKNIVSEYLSLFDSLKLQVSLITTETFCLIQALLDAKKSPPSVIADIGARTTNLAFVVKGVMLEAVTINFGGNDITRAIASEHGLDEIEAETKKIEMAQTGDLQSLMESMMGHVAVEIERFVQYVSGKYKFKAEQLLLAGGSALLPGLTDFLQTQVGVTTTIAKPLEYFKLGPIQANSPTYLPVLGSAAIAFHKKDDYLNFSPVRKKVEPEKPKVTEDSQTKEQPVKEVTKVKKKTSPVRLISLIVALLGAAGIFGFIWWQTSSTSTRPAELADLVNFKEINLEYVVNINPDIVVPGSIDGLRTGRTLSGRYDLDSEYWSRIKTNLTNSGQDANSNAAVYPFVVDDLARRMWLDQKGQVAAQYSSGQQYLLDRYLNLQVVTSSPAFADFVPNQSPEMALSINYTILLVDRTQYENLLNTVYASKYGSLPPVAEDKNTTVELLDSGNYRIVESIRYKQD